MPNLRGLRLIKWPLKIDFSKNLRLLYAIRVVRDLVSKVAVFFLPIYLYQQGSSHNFWHFLPGNTLQKGVLLLVGYYLIKRLTVLITSIPVGRLVVKLGFQTSLMLGFASFALILTLLYASLEPGWLILLSAVANGIETNFFWNAYHTLISKLSYNRHLGENLGLVQFLVQLSQAIAPALSGLLIVAYGFQSLFMVGLVGILACLVLTLGLDLKANRDQVSWREFRRWLKDISFWRLASAQIGRHLNDAALIFWPLYVFLLLGAVDRVGFLYSMSLFLAMMISFTFGSYLDRKDDKTPFYFSGGALSLLWIMRSLVASFWQVVIVDTLDRLATSFYGLFYETILLRRGKGGQAFSYFVYRGMMISAGALIFWLSAAGIFLVWAEAWPILFLFPAVGVLLGLLIKEHQ